MRRFEEVAIMKDIAVIRFLDTDKYTLMNLKKKEIGKKEFREISLFCDFPYKKNKNVEYADYYANVGFEFTSEDGRFRVNELGQFIYEDELYDELLKAMVENGPRVALRNLEFKNFAPQTSEFKTVKVAINTFMENMKDAYKAHGISDDAVKIIEREFRYELDEVIVEKQTEYKKYMYDMNDENFIVEDPKKPKTIPMEIFDIVFESEDQM